MTRINQSLILLNNVHFFTFYTFYTANKKSNCRF